MKYRRVRCESSSLFLMSALNLRGKRWVFTWNNYPNNWKDMLNVLFIHFEAEYLICEKETAPTTGTPHIQGYIRFKNRKYRSSLALKISCFWDIAKGTELENIQYCSKEKDSERMEIGEPRNEATEWEDKTITLKNKLVDLMNMNWEQFILRMHFIKERSFNYGKETILKIKNVTMVYCVKRIIGFWDQQELEKAKGLDHNVTLINYISSSRTNGGILMMKGT